MSIPKITLDQWAALAAVVDAGGYAKAAEALHKSQSSVTYAVQQLESLLGVKAFEIKGRNFIQPFTAKYGLDSTPGYFMSSDRMGTPNRPVVIEELLDKIL